MVLLALAIAGWSATSLWGQAIYGSIYGQVTDSSGAAIAKAGWAAILWGAKWIQTLSFIVISPLVGAAAGLVRRIRDTKDRRRVIVELTDEVDRRGAPVYGPLMTDVTQAHAVFDADQLDLIARFIRIERELLAKHTERVAAMSRAAVPLTAKRAGGSGEA